ncbi:IS5 family transposase [Rhodobaculum claviforme]|uniref:IS5/IS1182 family transposase n=1 Tax=Rhodobaculum claviforme TaxID=1549854 RepID=A0A934TNN3_9RHOB|nr:IS5 family transposase [Rhodobaculum claviforme]MBK5928428.1 IS5/IS1182 family transposase [Rhodobaculum claviforme]
MSWTELPRAQHGRKTGRHPSDLTAEEWAVVDPLLPGRNRLGRPRQVDLRRVWNAIWHIAASGCAWSFLPRDFPPVSTGRYCFCRWRDSGLLAETNRALVARVRHMAERDAQPTAGVIDSQSVKASENTSLSGFDAGKRIKGRKRHIITDTCGNLIACTVHSVGIQDRDGAPEVLARLRREAPNLRHMFADGGHAGPKLRNALASLRRWTLQIVKRSDSAKGFEVLTRRWGVERTFAWPGRCRRLARDWEKTVESAEAWLLIAHIRRLTRILARA